jgi:FkbM family methyltransferase
MNINELCNAYISGEIGKKIYWEFLRDKFRSLLECQNVMQKLADGTSIEITKNDIILNYDKIRIAFDFQQTFSRAETILALGSNPEQDDFCLIENMLEIGSVVFDIGANVGVFSLFLVSHCPSIEKIYAFEPVPETYRKMLKNLSLNNDPKQVCPYNIGLSDKAGSFSFYLPGASEAASMQPVTDEFYLRESIDGIYTGRQRSRKISCEVSTLDEIVQANPQKRIDLLKIDVEGNEKFVLEGASSVLRTYQPVVYAEMLRKHAARFHYHPNAIIKFMCSLGYQCYVCVQGRLAVFRQMDEDTVETNFFFLHQKKHEKLVRIYSQEASYDK